MSFSAIVPGRRELTSFSTFQWTVNNYVERSAAADKQDFFKSPPFANGLELWQLELGPSKSLPDELVLNVILLEFPIRKPRGPIKRNIFITFSSDVQSFISLEASAVVPGDPPTSRCRIGLEFTDTLRNFEFQFGTLAVQRQLNQGNLVISYCISEPDIPHLSWTNKYLQDQSEKISKRDSDSMFWDLEVCTDKDQGEVVKFPAHKSILAARSPVIRRMLQAPMMEAATNTITVTGFSDVIVKAALKFIYTEEVPDITDVATGKTLLNFGEMYQMHDLKAEVEKAIHALFSVETIMDIFKASLLYKADFLKEAALKYIFEHAAAIGRARFEEIDSVASAELILLLAQRKF